MGSVLIIEVGEKSIVTSVVVLRILIIGSLTPDTSCSGVQPGQFHCKAAYLAVVRYLAPLCHLELYICWGMTSLCFWQSFLDLYEKKKLFFVHTVRDYVLFF